MKLKKGKQNLQKNLKHKFETMRSFLGSIYTHKANIIGAEEDQSKLLNNIVEFDNNSSIRSKDDKDEKRVKSAYALYKGQELIINAFESTIFPLQPLLGEEVKMLIPKEKCFKD